MSTLPSPPLSHKPWVSTVHPLAPPPASQSPRVDLTISSTCEWLTLLPLVEPQAQVASWLGETAGMWVINLALGNTRWRLQRLGGLTAVFSIDFCVSGVRAWAVDSREVGWVYLELAGLDTRSMESHQSGCVIPTSTSTDGARPIQHHIALVAVNCLSVCLITYIIYNIQFFSPVWTNLTPPTTHSRSPSGS